MTMPHLRNCPHSEDWCLSCVKEMHEESENAEAKAAALDKILASWGMTWEQYRTTTGTDAPAHGREPNVNSQENRAEPA